jgi:hypothetical protein
MHAGLWDNSGVPKEFGTSEVTQCRNSKHNSMLQLASAWHTGVSDEIRRCQVSVHKSVSESVSFSVSRVNIGVIISLDLMIAAVFLLT